MSVSKIEEIEKYSEIQKSFGNDFFTLKLCEDIDRKEFLCIVSENM